MKLLGSRGVGESAPVPETESEPESAAQTTSETVLALNQVSKRFEGEQAVDNVSLAVKKGELLTLLGPSGCGKTTTLRTIAGLERPTDGRVTVNGQTVAGEGQFIPPEDRDVGIVFQEFALFPHMTAAENVAFGLDDWSAAKRRERVDELFELIGLTDQKESHPDQLSGGQQQRIALARALAPEPEVLLLDEPFSNLDRDLRIEMREEVRRILRETGVTGVFVTHDQEEALAISDRVAVMNNGHLEQIGHPEDVFQHPTSRFVARFLGDASFIPGHVHGDIVETSLGTIERDRVHGLTEEYVGTDIDVLVRPDDVSAFAATDAEADGRVTYRKYRGPTVQYRVEMDCGTVVECLHNHIENVEIDQEVAVRLTADHGLAWFPREDNSCESHVDCECIEDAQ